MERSRISLFALYSNAIAHRRGSALGVLVLGLLTSCTNDGDTRPADGSFTPTKPTPGVEQGPCDEGTEAACGVTIEQSNGIVSCFRGRQVCEDGVWGACVGSVSEEPDPTDASFGRKLSSLSSPARCQNNPCDPACMYFDEDPDDLSGALAPPLPLPTFGSGLATCSGDLCTEHITPDVTCSPCIAKVCAIDSSCCDDDWTDDCIDLVYEECTHERRPLGLCSFGLYSDTLITLANRSSTRSTLGAYGDIQVSTDSEFTGVISTGNITYANLNGMNVDVPDGIYAAGSVTFGASNSEIQGTVKAGTYVELSSGIKVTDDVWAGTDIRGPLSSEIWGNAYANTGISSDIDIDPGVAYPNYGFTPDPVILPPQTSGTSIPELETKCTGSDVFWADGNVKTITGEGVYDTAHAQNDGTIVLKGQGTYYFQNFYIDDKLILDLNGETLSTGWDIRVCDEVSFGNDARILGQGGVPVDSIGIMNDPALLRLYADTSDPIYMGNDVYFTGILMAPHTTINKGNMNSAPTKAEIIAGTRSAPINGALWGHSLNVGTNAATYAIDKDDCEALGIPGTIPDNDCPIVLINPPPPLVEPCASGLDCQMNHRCDDPITDPSCGHSKCMTGTALDATCDSCVSRICDTMPSCCGSDWSQACVDAVATSCDASCGTASCEHSPCSTGSALEASCDSCIADVCSASPSCCTGDWTSTCVELTYQLCGGTVEPNLSTGTSLCDYAVLSESGLSFSGSNSAPVLVSGGRIMSQDASTTDISYTTATSALFNQGAFDVSNSTLGPLFSGTTSPGSISNSTVDGVFIAGAAPSNATYQPDVIRPALGFSCSASDGVPVAGPVSPGNYGDVSLADGSSLVLSGGIYSFTNLTLGAPGGSGATLSIANGAEVTIQVCGNVQFNPFSVVTGPVGANAMKVSWEVLGNVSAYDSSRIVGYVNAAGAAFFADGARLDGALHTAGAIALSTGASVHFDGMGSACRASHDTASAETSSPARLCAYGAYAGSTLSVGERAVLGGGDYGGGDVSLGAEALVLGNLRSQNDVTLGDAGSLVGNAIAGGDVMAGTTVVQGATLGNQSSVSSPSFPSPAFACPATGADEDVSGSDTLTLQPNTAYGDINAWNGGSIELAGPGKYYVGDFRLNNNNTLVLPSTGIVEIYACGQVELDDELSFVGISAADAARFRVYSQSAASDPASPAIMFTGSTAARDVFGVYIAPSGLIALGDWTRLYGLVWADAISAFDDVEVSSTGFTGSACESLDLDNNVACPVTLTAVAPSEGGSCVSNAPGYRDTTCNGYDLALDVACGDTVPVCNHGKSAFSGTVQVGYYIETARQMSLDEPTVSPDGMCSASLSIPAGGCAELSCVVPAGVYSLVVDPESKLSECNNRRLDNWSVDDGRSCTPPAEDLTVNYEYEAECPAGTNAAWGLLTWSTETPGHSQVDFSARVAQTSAGLAMETFEPLGSAALYPQDRQICSQFQGPGCPVDITKELALGFNQGPFLELRIDLVANDSTPVLKDWEVTYTCRYDQ